MFKRLFKRRSLYLIHYSYQIDEDNSSYITYDVLKAYPKINCFKQVDWAHEGLSNCIKDRKKLDKDTIVNIVIKNIIKLD